MAAKRKPSAKSKAAKSKAAVRRTARKTVEKAEWKIGTTIPIFLLLLVFAAGFAYALKLEKGSTEDEPVQIVQNFIEKDADLQVRYIDVGQGDCTLIVADGGTVLIDAGEKEYGDTVIEDIKAMGIKKLDYVIATHPHSDHIGGLPAVIEAFEIGTVIAPKTSESMTPTTGTYERFLKALSKKGLKLTAARPNAVYSLAGDTEGDNTAFEILAPVQDYDDLNNYSVVIKLVHGENSFLFTGDIEKEAEEDILGKGADVSADVLKVGHHGSSTSTKKAFLEAVSPSVAVIECGIDNSYNHPNDDTLKRLDKYGVKYFRTDENGTVTIYSDGKEIRTVCEREDGNADG